MNRGTKILSVKDSAEFLISFIPDEGISKHDWNVNTAKALEDIVLSDIIVIRGAEAEEFLYDRQLISYEDDLVRRT